MGIPTRRRQVTLVGGSQETGMGGQLWSQQSWNQPCIGKGNGVSVSTTTYLLCSMVRLVHVEADG